ncbi:MAG: SDR family NAD(P)-dependent oxidoreductase, partial [Gammaproteobacteria bacterium]|nr:SDR family NAD(P)-dependent oxidoreductase [Gammaproteobacteria bacterium]
MNNNNYFTDKVVWITGASSGIGKAMARALDAVGARLILSARNENALKQIIDECQNTDNHQILAFDLTENDKLASVAKKAWKLNGKIDVLFNNGGIS